MPKGHRDIAEIKVEWAIVRAHEAMAYVLWKQGRIEEGNTHYTKARRILEALLPRAHALSG